MLKAQITEVKIGNIVMNGLMDEEGKFYVALPQIAEEFSFDKNQASRDIKPLLGKGFQFDKVKTPLNSKAVNAIPLMYFEKLILELALKGNIKAIEMSRSLIGLSLQQLFSDAFNIKFEKEERQSYLKYRQITREEFHPRLTKAIQENLNIKGNEWGKYIKEFQDVLNIENGTRDELNSEQLAKLVVAQNVAATLLEVGLNWKTVLIKIEKHKINK